MAKFKLNQSSHTMMSNLNITKLHTQYGPVNFDNQVYVGVQLHTISLKALPMQLGGKQVYVGVYTISLPMQLGGGLDHSPLG